MPRKDEPRITVRLSADLHERLAARAAEEHVKPGKLVREALEKALDDTRLRTCPHCGAENPETDVHCRCGHALRPPSRASAYRGMTGGLVVRTDLTQGDVMREEWAGLPSQNRGLADPIVGGTLPPPQASARHCERCGTPITSPSLRSHPNCGGKVLPPPS